MKKSDGTSGIWITAIIAFAVVVIVAMILCWHPWGSKCNSSRNTKDQIENQTVINQIVKKQTVIDSTVNNQTVICKRTSKSVSTVATQPTTAPTKTPTTTPSCKPISTAAIFSSLNGGNFSNQGEYNDTNLGERMTFTCRKVVVPAKSWNETLTTNELSLVENTWVSIKMDIPCKMTAVIFAQGLEQGTNHYGKGVLLSVGPGHYEFRIRNGEIVIWYPSQDEYEKNDLNRIFDQIKTGNFDIKSDLDFFGVSNNLFSKIPYDLIKKNNVQIIPDLNK